MNSKGRKLIAVLYRILLPVVIFFSPRLFVPKRYWDQIQIVEGSKSFYAIGAFYVALFVAWIIGVLFLKYPKAEELSTKGQFWEEIGNFTLKFLRIVVIITAVLFVVCLFGMATGSI